MKALIQSTRVPQASQANVLAFAFLIPFLLSFAFPVPTSCSAPGLHLYPLSALSPCLGSIVSWSHGGRAGGFYGNMGSDVVTCLPYGQSAAPKEQWAPRADWHSMCCRVHTILSQWGCGHPFGGTPDGRMHCAGLGVCQWGLRGAEHAGGCALTSPAANLVHSSDLIPWIRCTCIDARLASFALWVTSLARLRCTIGLASVRSARVAAGPLLPCSSNPI